MAYQLMWYETKMPKEIVDLLVKDLKEYENNFEEGRIGRSTDGDIDYELRKNKITFIPCNHWISGFCHHYISMSNKNNFFYDIEGFGNDVLQYSSYGIGEYYNWHVDSTINVDYSPLENKDNNLDHYVKINSERVRKLSLTIQLSDPEEYSGGEFQLLTDEGTSYFAPKEKGTVVIFDSRMRHRVRKVNRGYRKSLVGWAVGPRWK